MGVHACVYSDLFLLSFNSFLFYSFFIRPVSSQERNRFIIRESVNIRCLFLLPSLPLCLVPFSFPKCGQLDSHTYQIQE